MSIKQSEVPSWDVPDFPKPRPAGDFESDVPTEHHSDAETDSAFSRIEDALRDVAYQLGESDHTPSSPDTPAHVHAPNINAVTLEYTRSFNELAQRIYDLEKNTDTDSLRDDIRGLRQRLMADADRFNRALDESAGKLSTLAGAVDSLSNKFTTMRDKSAQLGPALEEHLNNLNQSVELSEAQWRETENRIEETVAGRLSLTEKKIENVSRRLERTELGRERSDHAVKQALTALLEKLSAEKERSETALTEARASLTSAIEEMQQSLNASERSIREGLENRLSSGETKFDDLAQRLDQIAPDLGEIENKFDRNFESVLDQLTAEKIRSVDALAEVRAALASSVGEVQQSLDATEKQFERTLQDRLSSVDANFESIARRFEQLEQDRNGGDSALGETIESMSLRLERMDQDRDARERQLNEAAGDMVRRLEQLEQDRNGGDSALGETIESMSLRLERMDQDRNARERQLNEAAGDMVRRLEQLEQDSVAKASMFEQSIAELKERLIAEKTRTEEAQTEIRGAVAELRTNPSRSAFPQDQSSGRDFAVESYSQVQGDNNRTIAEIIEELTASENMENAQDCVEPAEAEFPDSAESVDVSPIMPISFDMTPSESTESASSGMEESFLDVGISDESRSEAQTSDRQEILAGAGDDLPEESDSTTGAADTVNLDDVPNAPIQLLATRATGPEEKFAFFRQNRMAAIGAAILLIVGAGIVLFSRGSSLDPDNAVVGIVPAVPVEQGPAEQMAVEEVIVDAGLAAPLLAQGAEEIAAPGVPMSILSPLPAVDIQGPAVSGLTRSAPQAVEPGEPTTVENLISEANAGSSAAALLLGLKYLDGDGVATSEGEAFRWLRLAAEQGEPFAQNRLGSLFERGRGVAADAAESAFWYEQAARNGNVVAMHNLAIAHTDGAGVERDLAEAARLFEDAANLGLADSQFNLAVLYSRGMGVPASLSDAYKWYLIAAAQGDPEARTQAEVLAGRLAQNERDAAEAAAAAFVPQSPDEAANTPPSLAQIQ
jgi:localization factor PodJL